MKGFEKIIGHDRVKEYLDRTLEEGTPAHAYLFTGSRGLGKLRVAKVFAANLQNDFRTMPDDCKIIDTERKTVGIDLIRQSVVQDAVIAPFSNPYKIYIIKNADKMTVQAQNALLKTLEEPPEHVIIILLATEERKLLETVRSRCVVLNFTSPSVEETTACVMERTGLGKTEAEKLARLTDSNIGQALKYAKCYQDGEIWDRILHVIRHLEEMSVHEIISFVEELNAGDGVERELFFSILYTYYKDMLYYKISNDINGIVLNDLQHEVMKNVKILPYKGMYESVDAITAAMERLRANANPMTVLEIMLLNLRDINMYGIRERD